MRTSERRDSCLSISTLKLTPSRRYERFTAASSSKPAAPHPLLSTATHRFHRASSASTGQSEASETRTAPLQTGAVALPPGCCFSSCFQGKLCCVFVALFCSPMRSVMNLPSGDGSSPRMGRSSVTIREKSSFSRTMAAEVKTPQTSEANRQAWISRAALRRDGPNDLCHNPNADIIQQRSEEQAWRTSEPQEPLSL